MNYHLLDLLYCHLIVSSYGLSILYHFVSSYELMTSKRHVAENLTKHDLDV